MKCQFFSSIFSGNKILRRAPFCLLAVLMAVFAVLSLLRSPSADYASWWAVLLWACVVLGGGWLIVRHWRIRRWPLLLFHFSFVVILVGALLTHLTADRGELRLRVGEKAVGVLMEKHGEVWALPAEVRLLSFDVCHYDGTDAAADYKSILEVKNSETTDTVVVSMNNIYKNGGYRFYQTSYDPDMHGCVLTVSYDRWGTPVTYLGYVLLLAAMLSVLVDRQSGFRQLLRSPLWKGAGIVALLFTLSPEAAAKELPTFNKATAEEFGQILIQYQSRVTTVETYASDFLRKISGKTSYKDYTPVQVLCGWILAPQVWKNEPMIKIKGNDVKAKLRLDGRAKFADFFDGNGHYRLIDPEIGLTPANYGEKKMRNWAAADEKVELIASLYNGSSLKIYPYTEDGRTRLLSPAEMQGRNIPKEDSLLANCFFPLLYDSFQNGEDCTEWIRKFRSYQQKRLGTEAPSATKISAEHIYNKVYAIPMLSYLTVTAGMVAFLLMCLTLVGKIRSAGVRFFYIYLATAWLYLTAVLALRVVVSGRLPFGNGYETLMSIAWLAQIGALLGGRKVRMLYLPGLLISGFALLGASISNMDPQITPLMPVLNSPLLTIHVSLMMFSYTLAGFVTLIALASLVVGWGLKQPEVEARLTLLNRVLLYPTVFCMAAGIFMGAVWANVSWGSYWSWDPKETWALISMVVYGFAFHAQSLPMFRRPRTLQVYLLLAVLCLLMTYFGVNYHLGGMHSYAG